MMVLCVLNLDSYNLYMNFSYLCALLSMCLSLLVSIVLGANLVTCDIIHNYDMYFTTQKKMHNFMTRKFCMMIFIKKIFNIIIPWPLQHMSVE
jgi:hypothetical protein